MHRTDTRTGTRRRTRRAETRTALGVVVSIVVGLVVTASFVVAPPLSARQTTTSLFPAYDGFAYNDDGSLLLAFTYFNHNRTTTSVPIGEHNMFLTGEPDRGQPTTFLPGHHRFQCMMVVDGDFDGVLRWRLSLGDETHLTSDSMLQYSWEFDANSERQARRDVDPTTAPRNVCLNRSPIVRVLGPTELTGTVGDGVKLFGSVRDEGLPRNVPVTATWQQTSGPGTATFDIPDTPRTLAFFDRPGSYTVELRGSDSVFERTASVTVVIQPAR